MAKSFVTAYRWLLPSWLSEGDSGKVVESLAGLKDMFIQRARDGLEARFPSRAGDSALALIGADRGIIRGRDESTAHYAARLVAWRYPRGHRVRGNAYAAIEQVWEYFGGLYCWTVDQHARRYTRAVDGTESASNQAGGWDWDATPVTGYWARFWLVIEPRPEHLGVKAWPALGAVGGTWGGGTLGEIAASGVALGHQGISHQDARTIKRLFKGLRQWKPAGTRAMFAIVSLADHGAGDPAPDGTWGDWYGRDPAFRYWDFSDA